MAEILVLGAGPGGLAAAIGLAERGHRVHVVERDAPPPDGGGDAAFDGWDRRSVPQFRHSHGFSARAHNLLQRHAPAVLDELRADGIREINFFKELAPPELWEDGDEAFTSLLARRPAFELAMRRVAERTAGIEIHCPEVVRSLIVEESAPPRILGAVLDDGTEFRADIVIDAGGRRSPVAAWLREHVEWAEEVQPCFNSYYTRYYRFRPGSALADAQLLLTSANYRGDGFGVVGFAGDHDCFSVTAFVPPWDEELKVLRDTRAWDAFVSMLPSVRGWVDPDEAEPISDVATMTGHRNVLRRWVDDEGTPVALGVLPVGDSLCATNPQFGWGASMALTYAFAAVEAIDADPVDLESVAMRYHEAVHPEAEAVYRASAAADRIRTHAWRGDDVPPEDEDEAERQSLIADGIAAGATRDPVLGRAFLRRIHLLERPDAILDDPEVRQRAEAMRERLAARQEQIGGPTRADVLAAMADLSIRT